MRTGRTFIDYQDLYSTFGVLVADYRDIVAWPALKRPRTVDYPEEDGLRVDLASPQLDGKELDIQFIAATDSADMDALILALGWTGYRNMNFAEINKRMSLRYIKHIDHQRVGFVRTATIRMAQDIPVNSYTGAAFTASPPPVQGYAIDGVDLSTYGLRVLDGTDRSIETAPEAKPGMIINEQSQYGKTWDSGKATTYKEKSVSIKCLLYSTDTQEAMHNYWALLYDLTRPSARALTTTGLASPLSCYYDSQSVSRFELTDNGCLWCEFTIKLTVINSRPS